MTTRIDRAGVQQQLERGAQLVDVLPGRTYEEEHIAGAISLPLTKLDNESAETLDRDRPVITYCHDHQ